MKKSLTILLLLSIVFTGLPAQERTRTKQSGSSSKTSSSKASRQVKSANIAQATGDSIIVLPPESTTSTKKNNPDKDIKLPNIYGWTISPQLGERTIVDRDTTFIDFHQTTLVEGKDVAVGYLGNIGSPAQSKIFFNRPDKSSFTFLEAMDYWYKKPDEQIFLNTKIPYSNIFYQSAGGDEDGEEHFMAEISSNFGKKFNIGANFDYLYARGFYENLYNKQFQYDLNASYIGDRYKMHAFVANNYFNNSENGGIVSRTSEQNSYTPWYEYITNPEQAKKTDPDFNGNSLDIPTRLSHTFNRLQGRRIYVTNRYDLGNNTETVWVNDSTKQVRQKENYVPLASVIYTFNYTDQRRKLISNMPEQDRNTDLFNKYNNGQVVNYPRYYEPMNDFMSYYSVKNTLGFAMNEGFRSWTKFGLTVYAEHDTRQYSVPNYLTDYSNYPGNNKHRSKDALTIGGVLSKEKGKYLRYKAKAEKNLFDSDFLLQGEIESTINLKNKRIFAKAKAYVRDNSPSMFEEEFTSKYISWKENFSSTRKYFIGGELNIPFMNLKLSGGVENIKNYIYYDDISVARQESGNIQVISLQLDHKLKLGILHWNNQIVYQKTSNEDVLPLPDLSLYSDLYLQVRIAKVLDVQLGVDAHFHTKYYAPGYDPIIMNFYNQPKEKDKSFEIGGFPLANAYLNLNLKNTRFFIMYYNFASGMGNSNYFSLYKYAANPSILKMGLAWKFNN